MTILGPAAGRDVARMTAADFSGSALRAEFTAQKLALVAEPACRVAVQEEIAIVRRRLDEMALDEAERPALARRLAMLSGGMGVLKVGAGSKLATELRKTQAERARPCRCLPPCTPLVWWPGPVRPLSTASLPYRPPPPGLAWRTMCAWGCAGAGRRVGCAHANRCERGDVEPPAVAIDPVWLLPAYADLWLGAGGGGGRSRCGGGGCCRRAADCAASSHQRRSDGALDRRHCLSQETCAKFGAIDMLYTGFCRWLFTPTS